LLDCCKENNAASVCIARKKFNNHPKACQVPKWESFVGGLLLQDKVYSRTDNEALHGEQTYGSSFFNLRTIWGG
jgi:hypothetical protein